MSRPYKQRALRPLMDRLLEKLELIPFSECWIWMGATTLTGYGRIADFARGQLLPHRVMYESVHGPISPGAVILHTCDTRCCVNPRHLIVGTQQENVLDMVAKGRHQAQVKTHCPSGHPLSGENLYVCRDGYRRCLTCKRAQDAVANSKRRARA